MSDNRKILTAKRKEQRNQVRPFHQNPPGQKSEVKNNKQQDNSTLKRGQKRPIFSPPKKNLANDRLKKLRTSLNEDVRNSLNPSNHTTVKNIFKKSEIHSSSPSSTCSSRKRPPSVNTQAISVTTKVPRNNPCNSQVHKSPLLKSRCENESEFKFKVETDQKSIFTGQCTTTSATSSSSELTATREELMEWSPSDEQPSSALSSTDSIRNKSNTTHSEYFFIVIDTNVFLSQMQIIRDIIDMTITGMKKPVVFIPWMVIEELDFIKEDSNKTSLKWKAQEAIKYIEKTLTEKNERMMGQTLDEVNEQKDTGQGPDNKILSCCLQVLTKYQNMILLTSDINLRNKAHINHIPVCSPKEIMNKISLNSQNKAQVILEKMTSLCNTVIRECAKRAYGDASSNMPICQMIPQTMQDCIKVFNKYWFPVFQEVLIKQFKKSINDLSSFINNNGSIKDDSNELPELLRLCVRVCIFLKDVSSCKSLVEKTIREMNSTKDS